MHTEQTCFLLNRNWIAGYWGNALFQLSFWWYNIAKKRKLPTVNGHFFPRHTDDEASLTMEIFWKKCKLTFFLPIRVLSVCFVHWLNTACVWKIKYFISIKFNSSLDLSMELMHLELMHFKWFSFEFCVAIYTRFDCLLLFCLLGEIILHLNIRGIFEVCLIKIKLTQL